MSFECFFVPPTTRRPVASKVRRMTYVTDLLLRNKLLLLCCLFDFLYSVGVRLEFESFGAVCMAPVPKKKLRPCTGGNMRTEIVIVCGRNMDLDNDGDK